ncbi:hypothetical protein [uncultured Eubacterium sp.]|uniref:hypothetical protein n=1 Tax=uncultured Eubacterium sp. TaxID=165185 RepID=UPI002598E3F8|nr:hypothetical protein [uncultured Eubacterium sp.]
MKFEQLIKKLDRFTFEEIAKKYNDLYGTEELAVECCNNVVYDDDDLYEFLKELGAEIENYGESYAVIVTDNGKYFEVPYEERENRSGNDLPDETVLFFEADKIYDVTESYAG